MSRASFNRIILPDRIVGCAAWVRTVPELSTRPNLVAAMHDDSRLRRMFMLHVEQLIPLADRLYGLPSAEMIIGLVYEHGKGLLTLYEKKIPDTLVRAEMQGAYRNVWRNAVWRLSDGQKFGRFKLPDVQRNLVTDWHEKGKTI